MKRQHSRHLEGGRPVRDGATLELGHIAPQDKAAAGWFALVCAVSDQPWFRWFLALLIGFLGIALAAMPLLKNAALHSNYFDLGQYATDMFQLSHGRGLGLVFTAHINPYLLIYSAVYRLVPLPLVLLVLQSAALLAGAAATWRLWGKMGTASPMFGVGLYLLSVPVWYNDLFDFHFEHLLFIFYPLLFITTADAPNARRRGAALTLLLAICFVKEIYALSAAMAGLALMTRRGWRATGAVAALCAALYFAVATAQVIPAFTGGKEIGQIWHSGFGYLGGSISQIVRSILSDPFLIVRETLSNWRKAMYVGVLFGSLAFLPLLAPLQLLPCLPPLAIALLSRDPDHYGLWNQYPAGIMAPMLCAVPAALRRLPVPDWRNGAVLAALCTSIAIQVAFGPSPFSRLFWKDNWPYGYDAYHRTDRDAWIERVVDRFIPSDPTLTVSAQNDLTLPRLANRWNYFAFPDSVAQPAPRQGLPGGIGERWLAPLERAWHGLPPAKPDLVEADYIVLDLKRPLQVVQPSANVVLRNVGGVIDALGPEFTSVFAKDGLLIFARRVGTAKRPERHP